MKIIFLDIDGVLNSGIRHETEPYWYTKPTPDDIRIYHGGDWIEIKMLQMLKDLVDEYNLYIVGISSWFSRNEKLKHKNYKVIAEFLDLPIIDISNNTGGQRDRGAIEWIKEHPEYEVEEWCYLDDADHLFDDPSDPRLVQPSGRYGLQDYDIEEIKKVLKL